jgi:NAD(P)-dependent dehydrogenase (short-subunit alcohol dehydrogenase family)
MNEAKSVASSGVMIVGGTSGVGWAAARAFALAGARGVLIVGRDRQCGVDRCEELRALAPRAQVAFAEGDAGDLGQARRFVDAAHEHLATIDVLVNAAAATHLPTLFHRTPPEDLGAILGDIVRPTLLVTRLVLAAMREQRRGCIVNVASDAAKVATPGEAVIGAAMSAIVTFTRTLAMEAKRDGVRVNVLTPSLIAGTRTADRLFADDFSARVFDKARSRADLGVSTPEDQAALMLFLASPAAARITGQAISVNGGISAA